MADSLLPPQLSEDAQASDDLRARFGQLVHGGTSAADLALVATEAENARLALSFGGRDLDPLIADLARQLRRLDEREQAG